MKDFDDFVKSMDMSAIVEKVMGKQTFSALLIDDDPDSIKAALAAVYQQAVIDSVKLSYEITRETLRQYHSWTGCSAEDHRG